MESIKAEILKKVAESDMVLVGVGEEFEVDINNQAACDRISEAYGILANILEKKNYFIMTSCVDQLIYKGGLKQERIVAPRGEVSEYQSEEDYMKRWDMYTKWLGGTLSHSICVLELGVLINYPNIIRWPFEKIAFLNQKAAFIRINKRLPQLSEDISDKGMSVEQNGVDFLLS